MIEEPAKTPPVRPGQRIELTRADIEGLLGQLEEAMTAACISGRVELVGGAALALVHYDRAGTTDIDAALHPAKEIRELADGLATANGLRPGWLNNAAQGFFPPGDTDEEPVVVFDGAALRVEVAGPRTLLAMKLRASRPFKDADDIAVLLRACDVTTLAEARAILEQVYGGEEELSARGERLVLGALGAQVITLSDGRRLELPAVEAH